MFWFQKGGEARCVEGMRVGETEEERQKNAAIQLCKLC